MAEIADLLRKAGASEAMQRLSFITISRQQRNLSRQWFYKGTNSYNRHTLFELLASFYASVGKSDLPLGRPDSLPFPDFANVKIQRLKPQGGSEEIKVDLNAILKAYDRSKDIWLEWGDTVEVPELDHKVNERPSYFDEGIRAALTKCLERKVDVIVKGQPTSVTLRPKSFANVGPGEVAVKVSDGVVLSDFRLAAVVNGAGVLRASSDLTRVKVKRVDPPTGQPQEMIFNWEQTNPQTDLGCATAT